MVPGRPLSPVAPLCHTAGLPAALAQEEKSRYEFRVGICVFVCDESFRSVHLLYLNVIVPVVNKLH